MSFKVTCPECGATQKVKDAVAGKRINCDECSHRFLAKMPRDDDDGERHTKRARQGGGVPIWVWLAGGGGVAFVGLLLLIAVVLVIVRSSNRTPRERPLARVPDGPAVPAPGGAPAAPPGPHAAILQEFMTSFSTVANAVAQARDAGSTANLTATLRQETPKISALTQRLNAAGRVPDADAPRLRTLQDQHRPALQNFESEAQQFNQRRIAMRLPPNVNNELTQALAAYDAATRGFIGVAKRNMP